MQTGTDNAGTATLEAAVININCVIRLSEKAANARTGTGPLIVIAVCVFRFAPNTAAIDKRTVFKRAIGGLSRERAENDTVSTTGATLGIFGVIR